MASMLSRFGGWLYHQPYLLICITYMTWALNVVLGRYIAGHFPPVALSFFRWGLAFLIILPFAWPYLKRDWPVIRRHLPILTVLAITGTSAYNTMAYWGLQYTQAINALLTQSTAPLIIAVWAFAMYGDRLTHRQVIGILISLAGVIVILCRGDIEVLRSISFNRGDIWFFAALIIFAFYSTLMKERPAMHPLSFLAFSMGWGTLWLIPLFFWELSTGRTTPFDLTNALTLIYVAVFPSIVAYICYNRALELIGPNRVGALYPLIVAFGAAFAILLLGERPQLFHAAGCVLVLGGAIIATRKARVAAVGSV
jgi:drug/metabolite transporter (DMT)-like permease